LSEEEIKERLQKVSSTEQEWQQKLPDEQYTELLELLKTDAYTPQGLLAEFLDEFDKEIPLKQRDMLNGALPHLDDSLLPIFASDEDWEYYQDYIHILTALIAGPGEAIKNYLCKFRYVGPLRKVPTRNRQLEPVPSEAGWANGLAAWDTLRNSDENFIEKVNQWLMSEDLLNTGYTVRVKRYKELDMESAIMKVLSDEKCTENCEEIKKQISALPTKHGHLILFDAKNDIEVAPHDIGVGISQVLPVIVAALSSKEGLVAIEQPELHIHPALQVALGDLFINQAKTNPGVTFFLETHSEHLLLRLLRRIRDPFSDNVMFDPEDIGIYFMEPGDHGIRVARIRVDEDGDFKDPWPRGFFNERVAELF